MTPDCSIQYAVSAAPSGSSHTATTHSTRLPNSFHRRLVAHTFDSCALIFSIRHSCFVLLATCRQTLTSDYSAARLSSYQPATVSIKFACPVRLASVVMSSADSSSSSVSHTASDAANEALIADLLSPKQPTEHTPVTSAATDAILAAADKQPAHKKADSFYTTGLPDLAPQALSPVSGAAEAGGAQFTFNSKK